jgi:hypothetical protein
MDRAITRAALLLLVGGIVALAAACGGSEKESARDPKATLADVKPLPSAQTAVAFRILFDNAPASVGDKVELTFDGPLRNNGVDKLPSLDWKVAFSGLATKFTSRIVSTGNNFFINLGGQDFEAGEQAVQQLADQARTSKQKGLAQVGLNPLAAVRDVQDAGDRTFDGETLAVSKGAIDLDVLMDQVERLSQGLRTNGAAQTIPQGRLTAQQRGQIKRMFGSPRFKVGVADDDTVRQLLITSNFTTPAANREAAGGITGGRMEYRVNYTAVGKTTTITPPTKTQPMADFAREVQRILAKRG